ncbi:variant leucine-rich repeat-containing protein [Actinomyces naeslundii]|nr:hypothetical protein [Actinomyces naeslundii]QQC22189.1 hypothetical protein I6H94_06250 [Actinomyces naeslundii]
MTSVANAAPGRDAATTRGQAPDDPDLRLARDPKAGAGRLMVLAGNRPDLRAVIVDNPGCSPELRAWVGRMGVVGSGRSGRSVVEADSIGGSSAGDSGGAGDFGDSVSMAPTGWEPSDIGLGDDPFGSVLGDPLMGSPLFDGGPGDGPDDADVVGSAGGDADRAARPARSGGQDRTSSRRTSRPHTAAARTASRTTPPRTSSPRTAAPRPAPAPSAPAPVPPGRPAGGGPVTSHRGYAGGAPGGPAGNPWAPGGMPGYGIVQPTVPPVPSGPPASVHGAGRYAAGPRPGGSPSSSVSGASLGKVVGWGLFILIFMLIRMLT